MPVNTPIAWCCQCDEWCATPSQIVMANKTAFQNAKPTNIFPICNMASTGRCSQRLFDRVEFVPHQRRESARGDVLFKPHAGLRARNNDRHVDMAEHKPDNELRH